MELTKQGFLPEEELQGMAFIREMEKLGLLPESRHTTKTSSQRLLGSNCSYKPVVFTSSRCLHAPGVSMVTAAFG